MPGPPVSAIDIPIGLTVFGPILADKKGGFVRTDAGVVPFTLERTGFPVLEFRASPPETTISAGTLASALLPQVRVLEAYVDQTQIDKQIFIFFYVLGASDAEGLGAVSARARETSNNLVGLGKGAVDRAKQSPDKTQMERRLREPLRTVLEAISTDPDNFSAYLWAARLHLLLDEPHEAFDFFLTLTFRLRLFERLLTVGMDFDRELRDLRRAHAAARGRLDRGFWRDFREFAAQLKLTSEWPLTFPRLSKHYPG